MKGYSLVFPLSRHLSVLPPHSPSPSLFFVLLLRSFISSLSIFCLIVSSYLFCPHLMQNSLALFFKLISSLHLHYMHPSLFPSIHQSIPPIFSSMPPSPAVAMWVHHATSLAHLDLTLCLSPPATPPSPSLLLSSIPPPFSTSSFLLS